MKMIFLPPPPPNTTIQVVQVKMIAFFPHTVLENLRGFQRTRTLRVNQDKASVTKICIMYLIMTHLSHKHIQHKKELEGVHFL